MKGETFVNLMSDLEWEVFGTFVETAFYVYRGYSEEKSIWGIRILKIVSDFQQNITECGGTVSTGLSKLKSTRLK